jgi:signal transduction histidine kinase
MSVAERGSTVFPDMLAVLELVRGVLSDLDLDAVLERTLEAAREISGATYAAIGVLNQSRSELERFIAIGVDEETWRRIGAPPTGRGVLGELIDHPVPLRLPDVGAHPRSYGFPPEHPAMETFLGVPVFVGDRSFGNLYLTEKAGGEQFSERDEEAVVLLAQFAGLAIDHARRYSGLDARYREVHHTLDALDASLQIARALGGETDLDLILGLVAKRGRALVAAQALVIEYERDGEMVIAAGAGRLPPGLIGRRVDPRGSVASAALRTLSTLRLEQGPNMARFERHGLGRLGVSASAGLVVPLLFRGRGHGVLIAVDRHSGGPGFTEEDQRLLEAFAASAAAAVATAESVEADRRRQRLEAAERERAQWARELHDETLQSLAALRLGLAAQLARPDLAAITGAVREAVTALEEEIASLRSLITELRPAALDDLGIEAAIEDLIGRARARGLDVDLAMDFSHHRGTPGERRSPELETAIYRIVQEALTNASKHGGARRASVEIADAAGTVLVTIRDDGHGFDPASSTTGFGLAGMHERAELLGGTLEIRSAPGQGTIVMATFRVTRQAVSERTAYPHHQRAAAAPAATG